jgi:hypothetical protein
VSHGLPADRFLQRMMRSINLLGFEKHLRTP